MKKSDKRLNRNLRLFRVIEPISMGFFGVVYLLLTTFLIGWIFDLWNLVLSIFICVSLLFLIPEMWARTIGNFYLRKVTHKSTKGILENTSIVRYVNHITDEDLELYEKSGYIRLEGVRNASTNYVAGFANKRDPYTWFHLCEKGDNQPTVDSMLFNHMSELEPRKYKIIIDPKELDSSNLYIRPSNKNIAFKGDAVVKGKIETDFEWTFNQKLHLGYLLKGLFMVFHPQFHMMRLHQNYGKMIDNRAKRREKANVDIQVS